MSELERYRDRKCNEIRKMFNRGVTEAAIGDFIAVMINEIRNCVDLGSFETKDGEIYPLGMFEENLRKLSDREG